MEVLVLIFMHNGAGVIAQKGPAALHLDSGSYTGLCMW